MKQKHLDNSSYKRYNRRWISVVHPVQGVVRGERYFFLFVLLPVIFTIQIPYEARV